MGASSYAESSRAALALCDRLAELGLLSHIAELDAFGFTIVPPELAGETELGALVEHLLGPDAKTVGEASPSDTQLHVDATPGPQRQLPQWATRCTATVLLEDSVADRCAFEVVPTSHRRCRLPDASDTRDLIPIEATKGSAVVRHSNTWYRPGPASARVQTFQLEES